MTLAKVEIPANLIVVISSHRFEVHGVDKFRHVHNESGIYEAFIPVIKLIMPP